MKKQLRGVAISGLSLIALLIANGCSASKEETTRTYVPTAEAPAPVIVTPPPRVVVNPAPVVVAPQESSTTSTTVEKRAASSSSDYGPDQTSERSQSSYHSETSTVSPQ
jgi:hypothetical protein